MIDLHCHLIPEVDDGASSLEESMEMIRMYKGAGYAGAVCTSHFHPDRYLVRPDEVEDGVARLRAACQKEQISFTLHAGHEIYVTADTPRQVKQGEALPLAGSRYVLLELPFDVAPVSLPSVLFQLQLDGYIPIIGHLERYRYVQKDISWADEMLKNGALVQANLWSLWENHRGASYETGHALLRTGRVHFLATDAHGTSGRTPDVGLVLDALKDRYGEEQIELLTKENPLRVIKNTFIPSNYDRILREPEKSRIKPGVWRRLFTRRGKR